MRLTALFRRLYSRLFGAKAPSVAYDYSYENSGLDNVLVLTENVNATYYLSFHYVFLSLHKKSKLNFFVLGQPAVRANASRLGLDNFIAALVQLKPKKVVFTRYSTPYANELLEALRSTGAEIVYHIDDDLLNIPTSLGKGVGKVHANTEVVEARRYLLGNADKIYPSTIALQGKLSEEFNAPMHTGMYAPYLRSVLGLQRPAKRAGDTVVIGYMGSRGHQQDFSIVVPALVRILKVYPHVRFEMFGTISMPNELAVFGDRVCHHKVNSNYAGFLEKLNDMNWDIGLAPLEDNVFNKCKANTKFVEYTSCGIVTVASDVSVYRPCIAEGKGYLCADGDWFDSLSALVLNAEARKGMSVAAEEYCLKEFSLQRLEDQVLELLWV